MCRNPTLTAGEGDGHAAVGPARPAQPTYTSHSPGFDKLRAGGWAQLFGAPCPLQGVSKSLGPSQLSCGMQPFGDQAGVSHLSLPLHSPAVLGAMKHTFVVHPHGLDPFQAAKAWQLRKVVGLPWNLLSTVDGGRPGRRGMEAAVRRIDAQWHTAAFRRTGAARLAYGNCGRKPSLTANQKSAVVAFVKLWRHKRFCTAVYEARRSFVDAHIDRPAGWWRQHIGLVLDGATLTKAPKPMNKREKHAAQAITDWIEIVFIFVMWGRHAARSVFFLFENGGEGE